MHSFEANIQQTLRLEKIARNVARSAETRQILTGRVVLYAILTKSV